MDTTPPGPSPPAATPTTQPSRRTSHFGCLQCKKAKVKCDEGKPYCGRCQGQRIQCEYSDQWRNSRRSYPSTAPSTGSTGALELKLMHRWCCETCHTIATPGFAKLFQVTLPEIGLEHRYLLDAIFMLTAAHEFYKEPDRKLQEAIEKYKISVIAALRSRIASGITRENGEAVFTASAMLAIFSLVCDTETDFNGVGEAWMPLFQGSQQIYRQLGWWRHESVFAGLHQYAMENKLPDGRPYIHNYIGALDLQPDYYDVLYPVVHGLSRLAHQIMKDTEKNSLMYVVSWIMRLPNHFVGLVDGFDPCALIVMANFFQTLAQMKTIWIFKDYSKLHRQRIIAKLPVHCHRYLFEVPTAVPVSESNTPNENWDSDMPPPLPPH